MDKILTEKLDKFFWHRKQEEVYSKVSHTMYQENLI